MNNLNKKILLIGLIFLICSFLVSAFTITGYQVEEGEEEQLQSLCLEGSLKGELFSEEERGILLTNGFNCSEGDIKVSDVSGMSFKEGKVYFDGTFKGGKGEWFDIVTGDIQRRVFKGDLSIENPFSDEVRFLKPENQEAQLNVKNISKKEEGWDETFVWDSNFKEIKVNDLKGDVDSYSVYNKSKLTRSTQNEGQDNELKIATKKSDFSSVEDLENNALKKQLQEKYGDNAKNYYVLTSKEANSSIIVNDVNLSNLKKDSRVIVDPQTGEVIEITDAKFTDFTDVKLNNMDIKANPFSEIDYNLRGNEEEGIPSNFYVLKDCNIKDINVPEEGRIQIQGTDVFFPDNEHFFTGRVFVEKNQNIGEGELKNYYGIPNGHAAFVKNNGNIYIDNYENPYDTALFFQNTNFENREENPYESSIEMFDYGNTSRVDAYVKKGKISPKVHFVNAEERIEGDYYVQAVSVHDPKTGDFLPGQVSVTEKPYEYDLTKKYKLEKDLLEINTPLEHQSKQLNTNFVLNNGGGITEVKKGRIERTPSGRPKFQGPSYKELYTSGQMSREEYVDYIEDNLFEKGATITNREGFFNTGLKIDDNTGEVSLLKDRSGAWYTTAGEVRRYDVPAGYNDIDDFVKDTVNKNYADYEGYPSKICKLNGYNAAKKNEEGVYEDYEADFSLYGDTKASSAEGEKHQASITFDTPSSPEKYTAIKSGSEKKEYLDTLASYTEGDNKVENMKYRRNLDELYYTMSKSADNAVSEAVKETYDYDRDVVIEETINRIKNRNKKRMTYQEAVGYLEENKNYNSFINSKKYLTKQQFINYQKQKYADSQYKPDFNSQWEALQSSSSGFNRIADGLGVTTIGEEEGNKPTGIYAGARRVTYQEFFQELEEKGITLVVSD